jgi:TPR repeat protein
VALYGVHRGVEGYFPQVYCRLGVGSACVDASHRALRAGVDATLAYEASQRGCELGEGMACNNLGVCLQRGAGVAKDEGRARTAYQRGCDARIGLACGNLGVLVRDGRGGAVDTAGAERLFQAGCDFGSDVACRAAAAAAISIAEKLRWLDKACALGSARDCATGVLVFAQTKPKPEELAARAAKLNSACAKEDATSCVALGFLYRLGLGVPKDLPRSMELFQSACRMNHAGACRLVEVGGDPSKVRMDGAVEL